jgi:transcriptional/translational regulatory protein YebC/TACO1
MSGHSKWAGIKHKKALVDAKRGKVFGKLGRAITVAAREGGGDPDHNATLATAIQKAKDANMPHDNIDRAVKKGAGAGTDGETYLHLTYEGYGPAGVAVYLTALTDNKNRTAADVDDAGKDEDELMMTAIEAGAEDVVLEGDVFEIRCDPMEFMGVRAGLEAAGIKFSSPELTMIPKNTVALDEADAKKTFRLIDALEDLDDVQEVYANFDISDEVMEALEG